MHQSLDFRDPSYPDYMCLLLKSLYGLEQAPIACYQGFDNYVSYIGFTHNKSDHYLFIYRRGIDIAYNLLYVDDIIIIASSESLRRSIVTLFGTEFTMKDLDILHYSLGIIVTHHPGGLFLSQRKYAEEIISRAGMSNYKPSLTHIDTKPKLGGSSSMTYDDPSLLRSLTGAFQYLTFTRPDISYGVQQI
ncbi:hypothetical protein LIER_42133 [Lithospermum erythrorhizon]|uniref:Reverse transcriptase Ty1/copia-type domain-containing protein n=1 Tax=Lithospermum erythrorhizon TaxID=34254 RepID=A0AAV3RNN0_LITER